MVSWYYTFKGLTLTQEFKTLSLNREKSFSTLYQIIQSCIMYNLKLNGEMTSEQVSRRKTVRKDVKLVLQAYSFSLKTPRKRTQRRTWSKRSIMSRAEKGPGHECASARL